MPCKITNWNDASKELQRLRKRTLALAISFSGTTATWTCSMTLVAAPTTHFDGSGDTLPWALKRCLAKIPKGLRE